VVGRLYDELGRSRHTVQGILGRGTVWSSSPLARVGLADSAAMGGKMPASGGEVDELAMSHASAVFQAALDI
jgi:hypothetical protein